METSVVNLYDKFLSHVDSLSEGVEPQFIQMATSFEACRKKWLQADEALGSCKEVLAKAETDRGSLEVKLKHARNQVDVEIRRRQKAEAEYEKLERQLQLIRDLLISETHSSSVHLSEEQRNALAFLNSNSLAALLPSRYRLTTIDESASMLSDISYDQTDDSLDWDSSVVRTVKLRKRQKRVSVNESVVTKTTITVSANGGPVEAVSTIETVPYYTRNRKKIWTDTTTDQSETTSDAPSMPFTEATPTPRTPRNNTASGKKHNFVPKTVIRSEYCQPCGRRTKFGKVYLRCQECRVVTHPECREQCLLPCNPIAFSTPLRTTEVTLADFAPSTSPMVPVLVVYCIKEIERRGLNEVGLYRLSGSDRQVKELKEKLLRGKTLPALSKVEDINVITGVLKDFLRNLTQPLLTFHLNKAFMEAAEIQDEDNSLAMVYQAVSELPSPNRDTLACLMIHLQKVSQCPENKMDVNNLSRVFGPTLVGHALAEPDPMTILQDTSRQPRVVERLLKIPTSYWTQYVPQENMSMDNVSILGPVNTPEHHMMSKTPSSGSLSKRMMHTLSSTTIFGTKTKPATATSNRQVNFFSSPQLK
uniref:Rac GTPase-activating protein 1-like n=1 Tax=Gadus morhua TaxID=8049 RepID=A0A8C5B8F3_GADMO